MGFLVDSQPIGENVQPQRRSGGGGGDALNKSVVKIIETIQQRDMLPCIIFSFSRKECEMHASNVKKINFNTGFIVIFNLKKSTKFTEEEKETIRLIYLNALNLLSEEDRKLPQIQNVLPFLVRGIGIHHSGQLPIMKEIVEILFGEGLIKVKF
jgi:ATP-dependent RNA helicase DOB1